jgi:release factor glutamine methyltransferase
VYVNDCTYEPAEDTVLAIEAMSRLESMGLRVESAVDIGSGSGALALAAREILGARRLAAVEYSLCAAQASRQTLPPDAVVAVCPFASCLRGPWDLAVVNPPYLPEKPVKASPWECSAELWWAGGSGVMEGMIRAAARLSRRVIAVQSTLSPVSASDILKSLGFNVRILAAESFFMERLEVVWAWRS